MKRGRRTAIAVCAALLCALFSTQIKAGDGDELSRLLSLSEASAYQVTRDDEVLAEQNEEKVWAVGSAFKLTILSALADKIERGEANWTDVIRMQEKHRSLPSGVLQLSPAGTSYTLESLALLMIALSDNTATDILLDYVGRKRAEEIWQGPVLSTREFFILKSQPRLIPQKLGANIPDNLAKQLGEAQLPPVTLKMGLFDRHAEWLASPKKLCSLLKKTQHLSVFKANPGLASPANWQGIAFKGGSEPGVLSLSSYLTAKSGERYCVSLIWNKKEILNELTLYQNYQKILAVLKS